MSFHVMQLSFLFPLKYESPGVLGKPISFNVISGEAIGHPDGLAVIGIFFSLSPTCGFAIFCFLQILNLFDFSPMWYFLSFWSNTKFSICLIPGTTLRWLRCFPPSAPLLLLPLLLLPFPRQSPFPGDGGHLYFC